MALVNIRPTTETDKRWVRDFIKLHWSGVDYMISHGVIFYPAELPGFIAQIDDLQVGLITYIIEDAACEIVTLDNVSRHRGVGSALIAEVQRTAREAGCKRLWGLTTNDNLASLRFYQKRGFELVQLHRNSIAAARQRKPSIPLIGYDGIPMRDELEFEMLL